MSYIDRPRIIALTLTLVIINNESAKLNRDGELIDD